MVGNGMVIFPQGKSIVKADHLSDILELSVCIINVLYSTIHTCTARAHPSSRRAGSCSDGGVTVRHPARSGFGFIAPKISPELGTPCHSPIQPAAKTARASAVAKRAKVDRPRCVKSNLSLFAESPEVSRQ